MPRVFELRKFTQEEQQKRLSEIAQRSNKQLLRISLIQAAFLVIIFTVLTVTFGETTYKDAISQLLIVYIAAVAVWYLTSMIERAAARRRLKELKK